MKNKKEITHDTKKVLWNRTSLNGNEPLSDEQREFLYQMISENLNHARHVENERITFNSIYIAVVAGFMAFVSTIPELNVQLGMLGLLFILGLISIILTVRWNNVFKRHVDYASHCYGLLHKSVFGDGEGEEYISDGEEADEAEFLKFFPELPAYCFKPKSPGSSKLGRWIMDIIRTQPLFTMFYILLELGILVMAYVLVRG